MGTRKANLKYDRYEKKKIFIVFVNLISVIEKILFPIIILSSDRL